MATVFDDLPATAPQPQSAFANLPAQAPAQASAFAHLPPVDISSRVLPIIPDDSHFDSRSPNYDGPQLISGPNPGLLSKAYTAVREKLSPLLGPTDDQRAQQASDAQFLKKTLGVDDLPEPDATKTTGLIPAAFSAKTPWSLSDDTKPTDLGKLQLISNLLIPGSGGAMAARFPTLAAAGVNSGARLINTLTSPGSLLTLGLGGELGAVAKGGQEAASLAQGVKAAVEGGFTVDQARQLVQTAPDALKSVGDLATGKGDAQKNIENILDATVSAGLTGLAGHALVSDALGARSAARGAAQDGLDQSHADQLKNQGFNPDGTLIQNEATPPIQVNGKTLAPATFIGNEADPQGNLYPKFNVTSEAPGLEGRAGSTVSRDTLEKAGYHVPDTPLTAPGVRTEVPLADLLSDQSSAPSEPPVATSTDLLSRAKRSDLLSSSEADREQALRQSPLGGLALAADLREGRTAIPEDVRARDFALARDEENRAATAQSLKDALTSNQIGQGENITLAPGSTEEPPQNNILASLKLNSDLTEPEQFRQYLQSRAGTPPADSPLAGLQLKPLPDDAQFTVQSYTDRAGQPKRSVQLDIPNPNATGIADRTLPINSPEAALKAGYQIPDISKLPEGQSTVSDLRDLKLLPDAETTNPKTDATQKGPSAQSDLQEHPGANQTRLPAEAGRSDSTEQSGQGKAKAPVEEPEFSSGQSTITDIRGPGASEALDRINRLNARIEDVNTDIGTLRQKNNYTPTNRWSPEDAAEHDRLQGVVKEMEKARNGVADRFEKAKASLRDPRATTGDAAADEGLKEAAEEKPVPEIDKTQSQGSNPPDYKAPGIVADFLAPISTEIRRISPEAAGRLQRYETRIRVEPQPYLKRLGGFFKATDNLLSTHEKEAMGNALINGRFDEVENAIKAHAAADPVGSKAALDSFTDARAVFKELHEKAVKAGVDVNELHQFWPREVVREKFSDYLKYLGADEKGVIRDRIKEREKELGRDLNNEEKVDIANAAIKGELKAGVTAKPGIFKERKIADVTKEMEPFYEDYKKSAVDYVNRVISNVEKRSLFGKHPDTIDSSIGAIITKLSDQGKITGQMEDALNKYISDRFGVGEQSGNKSLQRFKDLNFSAILANPVSATTQFINFAQSAMLNGPLNSLAAVFAKREITMSDFGAHNIAAELNSRSGMAAFMNKAFDISGFSKVDTIGKNNILNAALRDMRSSVADTSSAKFKRFQERYEPVYGSQFPQFVNDLKSGNVTENVKMAVFARVCDVHPVTLSEMPLKYLQNPNGRIFYQMRTFQIKQLDLFRREVFQEIKAGNVARGVGNMARFGLFLTMAGATTDLVKDLMQGREINPPDYVLANILKLGGFGRYQLYNAYREGLGRAAADMMAPSLGAALNPIDDLIHLDTVADNPLSARTIRDLPFFGPFVYGWLGQGQEDGKTKIIGDKNFGKASPGLRSTELGSHVRRN
jgi:hypothetical protein